MKGKLKFVLPVPIVLGVAAAAYLTVLAPKKAAAAPPKVNGTLVELPTDFVVNLAGDHYAKLSVALLLSTPPPASATVAGTTTLPQDAVVRADITDALTGIDANELIDRSERHALLKQLLAKLKATTDEPVEQVLITDLAIQ
ncbi:MAG TPA: flagellar basal body-associated FliL family protein [Gaiellaceae bacterium]|nr:flagellar basal body-associated FliL family protein [Gaiellaceae bacterium]